MSQPTTAPNTTALSAYEKNGVVIVETGLSLWITTVVGIIVLCVAIGFGIYVAFEYPAENEDNEDVKRVIVGNKALSIIAGTFIFGLIVWYIVAMARRSKTWDNERLESEAATLFAHAYGEKAKQLAVGTGGEKLTGFKRAMYGHLKSVFNDESIGDTAAKFTASENTIPNGQQAGNDSAVNIGTAIAKSVLRGDPNQQAETRLAGGGGGEKFKQDYDKAEAEAAAPPAAAAATTDDTVTGPRVGNLVDLGSSPISLSRSYRRRKSPVKKKKKASPSSLKKKKSPSSLKKKKKSTSSRRK